MAFCLKLQLDLFIERIGCTGDFCSKYKYSSCPSLLRFVEARGLEKPAKIDNDRSGVFSSQALTPQETHTLCVFDRLPVVSWRRAKYKQMYGLKSTLTVSR